jgi:hypothetical protein
MKTDTSPGQENNISNDKFALHINQHSHQNIHVRIAGHNHPDRHMAIESCLRNRRSVSSVMGKKTKTTKTKQTKKKLKKTNKKKLAIFGVPMEYY